MEFMGISEAVRYHSGPRSKVLLLDAEMRRGWREEEEGHGSETHAGAETCLVQENNTGAPETTLGRRERP